MPVRLHDGGEPMIVAVAGLNQRIRTREAELAASLRAFVHGRAMVAEPA
jgi:hypothetical protein